MISISTYHANGRLICDSNMHLLHIGSDYRQLLWVLLGHPHPRKVALSSTRVLSMQGFALLNGSLAGRFIYQSIHPPPSISPLDQPISNCAGGLPAVGWTPIINRLVKRLVEWRYDGGSRNRFANCGQLSLLQISGEICLLNGRHKFAMGKRCSSFGTSRDVSHQNRSGYFWGSILACATGVAHSALLRTKTCAGRFVFVCLVLAYPLACISMKSRDGGGGTVSVIRFLV